MVITVAGDKKEVKDAITVSELIVQENVETPQYVTVSVNDDSSTEQNLTPMH